MAKNKGKGWHGDPEGHREAGSNKGKNTQHMDTDEEGNAREEGRGWHGDPEGHSKASKGERVKDMADEEV